MQSDQTGLTLAMIPEWVSKDVVAAGEFVGRLGRHVEHDAQSLAFMVDHVMSLVATPIRTKVWTRFSPILNQGDLGSCTGNAMTGWLGCAPNVSDTRAAIAFDEGFAVGLYEDATRLDNFPGQYPPDDTGSSGLAVAKAAKARGLIHSYLHARTTLGMVRALMHAPVIIGIPWYDSFDTPDINGRVHLKANARVRGGHELLVRGFDVNTQEFVIDNSWGPGWGQDGSFLMPIAVWNVLRSQQADVTIPVK